MARVKRPLASINYGEALESITGESGGFSYGGTTGKAPGKGIMVSHQDYEKQYPLDELDENKIREFAEEYGDVLRDRGNYLGGWANEDTAYLDVSARHALGSDRLSGQTDAYDYIEANNQLAGFRTTDFKDVTLADREGPSTRSPEEIALLRGQPAQHDYRRNAEQYVSPTRLTAGAHTFKDPEELKAFMARRDIRQAFVNSFNSRSLDRRRAI